jgi:hypothetical protein
MPGEASLRYAHGVSVPRPRGARELIGYSPKLKRRVTLTSRAAFEAWLLLESDPHVVTFCERPILIKTVDGSKLADFWARYQSHEAFLVLSDDPQAEHVVIEDTTIALRSIARAELAAARVWVNNWERMLPVINASVGIERPGLEKDILQFLSTPQRLLDIEREYAVGDPSTVRACVFELLRMGQITAPSLRTEALSLLTSFGPTLQ